MRLNIRANTLKKTALSKEFTVIVSVLASLACQGQTGRLFAEHEEATVNGEAINVWKAEKNETVPEEKKWLAINDGNLTIYYKPEADLKGVERKLRRRTLFVTESQKPGYRATPAEKIAYRMGLLLRRAKEILGMRPRNMKVTIRIFKDRNELKDEYYRIFKKHADFKSFYIHKYTTIYTTENDISDSVMAHEMGHAIVDHYFVIKPPEEVREILATYVDAHLEE